MYIAFFLDIMLLPTSDYSTVQAFTCTGKPIVPMTHCVAIPAALRYLELIPQYLWGICLYFAFWDTRLPPTIPACKGRGVLLKWEAFYVPLAMVLALKGCARRSGIWKKNALKFLYSSPSTRLGEAGAFVFHLEFINVLNQGELAPSIPSDTMLLTTWKNKGFLPPEISNPVEHLEDYEILIRPPSSSPETSLWRPRTDRRKPLTPKLGVHVTEEQCKGAATNDQQWASNTNSLVWIHQKSCSCNTESVSSSRPLQVPAEFSSQFWLKEVNFELHICILNSPSFTVWEKVTNVCYRGKGVTTIFKINPEPIKEIPHKWPVVGSKKYVFSF